MLSCRAFMAVPIRSPYYCVMHSSAANLTDDRVSPQHHKLFVSHKIEI